MLKHGFRRYTKAFEHRQDGLGIRLHLHLTQCEGESCGNAPRGRVKGTLVFRPSRSPRDRAQAVAKTTSCKKRKARSGDRSGPGDVDSLYLAVTAAGVASATAGVSTTAAARVAATTAAAAAIASPARARARSGVRTRCGVRPRRTIVAIVTRRGVSAVAAVIARPIGIIRRRGVRAAVVV